MIDSRVKHKWFTYALWLSMITILYNLVEGGISTWFGAQDETLALFGFGVDSFVEVISGAGILHFVLRMQKNPDTTPDEFEMTALRITGTAFYLLTAGLISGSLLSLYTGNQPLDTTVGVVVSAISIATMYILYRMKLRTGQELRSDPIISDANCTKTCFYLSFILLASSLLYQQFGIPYIDVAGSLGIAWYAFKEGREAFEKAHDRKLACASDCC